MSSDTIVIVGAGHGGVQLAASLREEGYGGKLILLGDEKDLPYQRPPLSKAYLKRATPEDGVLLRGPDFYAQNNIELLLGERVTEIDRAATQAASEIRQGARLYEARAGDGRRAASFADRRRASRRRLSRCGRWKKRARCATGSKRRRTSSSSAPASSDLNSPRPPRRRAARSISSNWPTGRWRAR